MTESKTIDFNDISLDFSSADLSRTSIEAVGNELEDIVQLNNFNGRVKVSGIKKKRRDRSVGKIVRGRRRRTIFTKSLTVPPGIKPMKTVLHSACEGASPTIGGLEMIYNSNKSLVFTPDLEGKCLLKLNIYVYPITKNITFMLCSNR